MDSDRDPTTGTTRTLDEDALWELAEQVDLPTVFDDAVRNRPARPDPAARPPGAVRLPVQALTTLYQAGRAASAARRRLHQGNLTVDVVGAAPQIWWHAGVLCRSLWLVTHLAVTADVATVPPRLADQLDLAGVEIGSTTAPGAAFGASLIVAAGPADLDTDRLAPGALLVEAVPDAFPAALHRLARNGPRRGAFRLLPAHPPDSVLESAFAREFLSAVTRPL